MTFYNSSGTPIAYTSDSEHIYLFNGSPVGYLKNGSAYGYNGKYLGWHSSGWIFDRQGKRAFFTHNATGGPVRPVKKVRPVKSVRKVRPIKAVRRVRPVRPVKKLTWSSCSGAGFFDQ